MAKHGLQQFSIQTFVMSSFLREDWTHLEYVAYTNFNKIK